LKNNIKIWGGTSIEEDSLRKKNEMKNKIKKHGLVTFSQISLDFNINIKTAQSLLDLGVLYFTGILEKKVNFIL